MATFKNRALTLATVGLLSGAPVTIATDGIIQLPEGPTGPPPVEVIDSTKPAGGFSSIPDREFHVSLRGEYRETEWFRVIDRSGITFEAVPRDSVFDVPQSITLLAWDETVFSQYTRAEGTDLVLVMDSSGTAFTPPQRMEDVDSFVIYEDGGSAYLTTASVTRARFVDRFPVSVRMQEEASFAREPYIPLDVRFVDDLPIEIEDVSDNDFTQSRLFASIFYDDIHLAPDADVVFVGGLHSSTYLVSRDAASVHDQSIASFTRPFVEPKDDMARILVLFAQAFLDSEDD